MFPIYRITRRHCLAGLAFLAMACDVSEQNRLAGPEKPIPSTPSDPSEIKPPATLASITLPNGNVVEFLDFKVGVMVTEMGPATTPQSLPEIHEREPDYLLKAWKALAPQRAFPKALDDAQKRLLSPVRLPEGLRPQPPMSFLSQGGPMSGAGAGIPDGTEAAMAQGNGCTDVNFLKSRFHECNGGGTWSWLNLNFGWSIINYPGVGILNARVCAGGGQSQWNLYIGGYGGSWSIPEGYSKGYRWYAGLIDHNLWSGVNSQSDQHLHSYCGYVWD